MAVVLENFLNEYEASMCTSKRRKSAWQAIRAELHRRRGVKNRDIPNDTTSKLVLSGAYDYPDDMMISKTFRDYVRANTEFVGNGGFPA